MAAAEYTHTHTHIHERGATICIDLLLNEIFMAYSVHWLAKVCAAERDIEICKLDARKLSLIFYELD